ncbi:hypothetical protein BST61_g2853 [Cercospora zeina]
MSSFRSVQRSCLFCNASVLLRRRLPTLALCVGHFADFRPVHTSPQTPETSETARQGKRQPQYNWRGGSALRKLKHDELRMSQKLDASKSKEPGLDKFEKSGSGEPGKPRRNDEDASDSSQVPRASPHTRSTSAPGVEKKSKRPHSLPAPAREKWAVDLGLTVQQERGFDEIKDIWERLAYAEILYDERSPITMPEASGIGEVNNAKQVKEERLAAAAKVGASKVLQWLRTLKSHPKMSDGRFWVVSPLDKVMTMSGEMWQPLAWHMEAERLVESFQNSGKLAPSVVEDWILKGQDVVQRAPANAPFVTPIHMPLAHLRAVLYWHECPDAAIDFVCRLPSKELIGRLCTSSTIRKPCAQDGSFGRFLSLELSHWQRNVAMLWHPTNPDALPFTALYTDMLERKQLSKERKRTAKKPEAILENHAFILDVPRAEYILRLQGRNEEINHLKSKERATEEVEAAVKEAEREGAIWKRSNPLTHLPSDKFDFSEESIEPGMAETEDSHQVSPEPEASESGQKKGGKGKADSAEHNAAFNSLYEVTVVVPQVN